MLGPVLCEARSFYRMSRTQRKGIKSESHLVKLFIHHLLSNVRSYLDKYRMHGYLLGAFCLFLYYNGGIVLGDRSNHVSSFHAMQLLYACVWIVGTLMLECWESIVGAIHCIRSKYFRTIVPFALILILLCVRFGSYVSLAHACPTRLNVSLTHMYVCMYVCTCIDMIEQRHPSFLAGRQSTFLFLHLVKIPSSKCDQQIRDCSWLSDCSSDMVDLHAYVPVSAPSSSSPPFHLTYIHIYVNICLSLYCFRKTINVD
jgi:hypothetical protein